MSVPTVYDKYVIINTINVLNAENFVALILLFLYHYESILHLDLEFVYCPFPFSAILC